MMIIDIGSLTRRRGLVVTALSISILLCSIFLIWSEKWGKPKYWLVSFSQGFMLGGLVWMYRDLDKNKTSSGSPDVSDSLSDSLNEQTLLEDLDSLQRQEMVLLIQDLQRQNKILVDQHVEDQMLLSAAPQK